MISGISSSTSAASVSELRQQMFNKIDTNGDGSIDQSEMTTLIEENASSLASSIFGSQDTNQDGLVSQLEFDSGMAKLGQEMKGGHGAHGAKGAPPPEKVFDAADTNEDGVVSKDELAAVLGGGGDQIDKIFGEVDTDGDGVISRSEDDAHLAKMEAQGPPPDQAAFAAGSTGNADSTDSVGTTDFKSQLFAALIQVLTASSGDSGQTTSLLA